MNEKDSFFKALLLVGAILGGLLIIGISSCRAEPGPIWNRFSDDQIANAIYRAENSKAHPYGILAHYKKTTPRQACINTIKHARKDFKQGDFIVFLGARYCPVGAANDPRGLNKNWVNNVKAFLLLEIK